MLSLDGIEKSWLSGVWGGWLISTMPGFTGKCFSTMTEWAEALCKRNQLPFSQNCGFSLNTCFNNLSSTCMQNSLFFIQAKFLCGSHPVYEKMIDAVLILDFCKLNFLVLNDEFVTHPTLWHFVSGWYWNTQDLSPSHALTFCFRMVLKHPRLVSINIAIEKVWFHVTGLESHQELQLCSFCFFLRLWNKRHTNRSFFKPSRRISQLMFSGPYINFRVLSVLPPAHRFL
jgi:hypothetical protein